MHRSSNDHRVVANGLQLQYLELGGPALSWRMLKVSASGRYLHTGYKSAASPWAPRRDHCGQPHRRQRTGARTMRSIWQRRLVTAALALAVLIVPAFAAEEAKKGP